MDATRKGRTALLASLALVGYDSLVRPRMLDWGATFEERVTGTVHYVEGKHSAIRIHPELQSVRVGDWIATGSIGTRFRIDAPVTRVEPGRALLIGTWAFVLVPVPGGRTGLLVRQRYPGWIRLVVPARLGVLQVLGGAIDYAFGGPLHS